MKSSTALKLARARIKKNLNIYVCCALEDVDGKHTAVYKNIYNLLQGRAITYWLHAYSPEFRKFSISKSVLRNYNNQLHLYRIRWIDWMIKHYEKAGD